MGSPFLDDVPVDDIAVSQLPYFFFVFLTLLLRSNYIFLILFLCHVSIYTLIFINIIRTNKFSMPGWVGILLFFFGEYSDTFSSASLPHLVSCITLIMA